MNLNMIRPENETRDSLRSITKKCETQFKQTHRKAEGTLGFELNKSKETFHFNPPMPIEGSWMVGLISLEVYNSIFNITEQNNKFEIYADNFDQFSFEELGDELEEMLNVSDITSYHLQHEQIGPVFLQTIRKLRLEKSSTGGFIILLLG